MINKGGINMYKILQLTNSEANVLDEIIRIYKLPLEVCVGDPESDYIVDLETEDNYSLLDGVYEILEAIHCDDRELYKEHLDNTQKSVFEKLCNELGIDSGVERVKVLERSLEYGEVYYLEIKTLDRELEILGL